MKPIFTKLNVSPLFFAHGSEMPNIYSRVADITALGRVNMIVIDGKAQCGKSTLGIKIAADHDKNWVLVFTVQEILDHLKKMKDLWFAGRESEVRGRWIVFDEPNLASNKKEFWTARAMIIESFTSSFGFLKQNIILCLPNIKGLSDIVLTNISMRITVRSFLQKKYGRSGVIRKGYVKIPLWDERHNKFLWTTVEEYTIPDIADDIAYNVKKARNFFDNALDDWQKRLNTEAKIKPYTPYLPRDWQ